MMKRIVLILAMLAGAVSATMPAQAAGLMFGHAETLHRLVDVDVVGENNEPLSLGYKTSTQSFLLPYTMSDDGYILIPRDRSDTFYPISEADIAGWQANGTLPDPLPAYEIPLMERIMGVMLWPALVVIALLYLVPWWRKRAKAAQALPPVS